MRGSKARLVTTAIVAASRFPLPRLYRSPGTPNREVHRLSRFRDHRTAWSCLIGTVPAGISEWTGEKDSHFAFSTVPPQLSTWRSDPPGLRRRAQGHFFQRRACHVHKSGSLIHDHLSGQGGQSTEHLVWGQVRVPSNLGSGQSSEQPPWRVRRGLQAPKTPPSIHWYHELAMHPIISGPPGPNLAFSGNRESLYFFNRPSTTFNLGEVTPRPWKAQDHFFQRRQLR
jgi:hypothetical protein